MSLFDPASRLGRGAGALLALAVATGCAAHHAKYPRSPSTAFQEYHATTLARLFEPAAAEHPGESGVLYMRYGSKALVARLALADLAERSLDLQYYQWDAVAKQLSRYSVFARTHFRADRDLCHRDLAFQAPHQLAQSNIKRRKLMRIERLLIVAMLSLFFGYITCTTQNRVPISTKPHQC